METRYMIVVIYVVVVVVYGAYVSVSCVKMFQIEVLENPGIYSNLVHQQC